MHDLTPSHRPAIRSAQMSPKKTPRYRTIADQLINAILGNQYPIGSALPAEAQLCEKLDASRHTIREALRILEETGLITRRQGSGSEVIANTPPVRYRQTVDTIEGLLQYGQRTRLTLVAVRERPLTNVVIAARFRLALGTPCIEQLALRSERVGTRDGPTTPFAMTTIHLPPQPPKRRDKLIKPETALSTMLTALDARTIGRIEQTFEAVALDAAEAAQLQVKKGVPALRADRTYFDREGRPILVAISLHRADRFKYSMVLRHEGAESVSGTASLDRLAKSRRGR